MSLIATAKNKAAKGSVAAAFKNEAGAIDLASIMVGIIVIGLIGGVIAATVFSVIPWAQDNAAKQQLDSIAAAQSASIGQSADGGAAINFAPLGAANVSGTLANEGLLPATVKAKVAVQGTGADAHYAAVVKSASGKYFYISDTKTQASEAGSSGASAVAVFTGSTTGANSSINGIVYNGISWTGSF